MCTFTTATSIVWLCGQPPDGAPVCVSKDNFPDVTGYSTIELTLTPQLLTQFIWLRVRVPDADDNGPFGPDGTSGVIGYWIYRKP